MQLLYPNLKQNNVIVYDVISNRYLYRENTFQVPPSQLSCYSEL